MVKVPIADVVRPSANRNDCDEVGESMHALADQLAKHMPGAMIEMDYKRRVPLANHWYAVQRQLTNIRDTGDPSIRPAIERIIELAKPYTS